MDNNEIDWSYAALLERAEDALKGLDARGRAIAEIERRSAAMVEGMRDSSFRRT